MSLAELVIKSVKVEGRTKSEVARDYKLSRYWVHQLVSRYEVEGESAFQPRSKRPTATHVRSPPRWRTGSSGCARN
jgi:transposase